MRRAILVAAAAVLALSCVACAAKSPSSSVSRPVASVETTRQNTMAPSQSQIVTAAASANWAKRDAYLYWENAALFAQAATEAALTSDADLAYSLGSLSRPLAALSANARAWCVRSEDRTDIYFNTGTSNYPCADGVVYSTSATQAPYAAVTTPVQIAPHWWVAAWDPLMFDSFGYGPNADQDFSWDTEIARDVRHMTGSVRTVSGRIVGEVDVASYGLLVIWVDTGGSKPVPVVLNATSKLHWPASWGKVVPDPESDTPAVQLPSRTPEAIISLTPEAGSIRVVARVKTVVLPSKRRQGFALDLRFSGK